MTLEEFLSFLTKFIYALVALITLVDWLRHRDRTRLDIALVFVSLAATIIVQSFQGLIGVKWLWLEKLGSLAVISQPYFLLRLAQYFRPVQKLSQSAALLGLAFSWIALLLYSQPLPLPITLFLIVYFVIVEVYATYILVQGALTISGITGKRLRLASAGSGLLASLFIVGIVLIVFGQAAAESPALQSGFASLIQVIAILSGLSYYFGFAPPRWLIRSWQLNELHLFLQQIARQPEGHNQATIFQQLSASAMRTVGGAEAVIAHWDPTAKHLNLTISSEPSLQVENLETESVIIGRVWRQQRGMVASVPHELGPATADWAERIEAQTLLIVPVISSLRSWGLLIVALRYAPLFATDDIDMLTLLAEQSTIPLDHTLLITELQSANQSLEQHVAKRTSQLVTINKQLEVENTERKIAEEKILHINEELEQRVVERTQRLEDANQELVNSRKEIQGILDSMATLNAKVALDGTLLFANKIATQAAGVTFEELMKTNFLEGKWWTFDPEVQTRVKNAFAEAVSGIKISYDEKIFVFGQILAISFSLTPMLGSDDHVEYVLAEARDISKLKQIEESLQAKTIQLEAANRELESFSYSVSHDLRAPLRTIDGFSQAILEDYSDKLPEEGRAHLDRVRKATQNMANLIDDLLNLSRVTRAPLRSEPIDLSKFAAEIYDDLQRNHPERNVKFTIAENLKAKGDPHLIQDVLENFINNAWKFTSKRDQALIEFGSKRENDESIYFIRDNGAGFDMAYANKLFGAFQRLHSTSEFPGTGIGLATVQRIINRHGGRVWAESIIDQGTTFYFTLG